MLPVPKKTPETDRLQQHDWIDLLAYVVASGRRLQREIDRQSRSAGLSDSQFLLLWISAQGPDEGSSQTEMAKQLGLSAPQVSGLVEQLRRQGLLESQRAPADRRRQLWRVTSAGEQTLKRVARQWNFPGSQLSETLSPSLQDELRKGLSQIDKIVTDAPPALRVVSEQGGVS